MSKSDSKSSVPVPRRRRARPPSVPKRLIKVPRPQEERVLACRRIGLAQLSADKTLSLCLRRIPGGFPTTIETARTVPDERFQALVTLWDDSSDKDRRALIPEDWVRAAKIDPADYLAEITRAAYNISRDTSSLLAAVHHPDIVQASIQNALTPEGFNDRRMLFQHMAFLPLPKGQTINIQNNSSPTAVAAGGLTPFEQSVRANVRPLRKDEDDVIDLPAAPREDE